MHQKQMPMKKIALANRRQNGNWVIEIQYFQYYCLKSQDEARHGSAFAGLLKRYFG